MSFAFNAIYGTLDLVGEGGDVFGPSGATDNAIARYDGTTGKLIQDSKALVQDGGAIQTQGLLQKRNIDDDILIPDNYVLIDQDINMTTGNITMEGDGEITLID